MTDPVSNSQKINAINSTVRYTMWSVFRYRASAWDSTSHMKQQLIDLSEILADEDIVTRGWYDISGFRADADIMVWWHAPSTTLLQKAYRNVLRETVWGSLVEPVWSNIGVHRPAEFNKSHVPAFMADERAREFLCVYPFVRSYEWYLLPDDQRRDMLVEHGRLARGYPDVRANTVSSFALGDYEWLLAFEADDVIRIVDLMRDLRASQARLHVREEVPFFTGQRLAANAPF